AGESEGIEADRGRVARVEVGRDLRPLRLDRAPGQAPVDDDLVAGDIEAGVGAGQAHPLVVLGHTRRNVPGLDKTPDQEVVQRVVWAWPGGRGYGPGVPVVQRR